MDEIQYICATKWIRQMNGLINGLDYGQANMILLGDHLSTFDDDQWPTNDCPFNHGPNSFSLFNLCPSHWVHLCLIQVSIRSDSGFTLV